MKTWFTADTHFGHTKIIDYCNRPFKDIETMNKVLIRNWNARIKKHDLVIHLGDFAFKEAEKAKRFLDSLNGHITIVKGNHDKNNSIDSRIMEVTMDLGGKNFYCVHNPSQVNYKFHYALVGHVHQNWKVVKRKNTIIVNVGVDVWNYHPIDINEIFKAIVRFK